MTTFTLHTLDLPAFQRRAIGFNRMFNELNQTFTNSRQNDSYPPYNIINIDETHHVIELAVAGFKENELDVGIKDNTLTITGKKEKETDAIPLTYAHKGISTRSFEQTFNLAEHMEVRNATVENGIMTIALELVIPEERKAKKVTVTFAK